MASSSSNSSDRIHRFPQSNYIDSLRFLPPLSPFHRLIASAVTSPSSSSSLEIHSLTLSPTPSLSLLSSFPSPSRITSLKSSLHSSTLCFSTSSSSLHFLFLNPLDPSLHTHLSLDAQSPVSAIDLTSDGSETVTVAEDGKINVVTVGEGKLNYRTVSDAKGLISYTEAKWGSPSEFATGGLGFGLQWWDQRKSAPLVHHFKPNWDRGRGPMGMVHSIDIHTSRKHVCVVGGSCGTVFAWDLRWPQQPVVLSGVGMGGTGRTASESEVWEVKYDSYAQSSSVGAAASNRILPVMMCSEDGILAVIEQGEEPVELLEEPCAINAFDIDPQNPSDVIIGLEWETIGILMRSRETMTSY